MVASSLKKGEHLIGIRNDEKIVLGLIEYDGVIPFTISEFVKALGAIKLYEKHLKHQTEGDPMNLVLDFINLGNKNEEKSLRDNSETKKNCKSINLNEGVPLTARLMAYYRSLEEKKENPLILDPLAERLAGDLSAYIESKLRISEMDYPIVRSRYIDEELLKPWCETRVKSQIVLLGAV
ncbi:MAG: hypothetical protein JW891_10865 [Candidatus Lokiarchaeota archaeon]|nr:hypothetical protein [Candidatus Lokiarchaeota archaeon]